MSFQKDGFLGEEISKIKKEIIKKHSSIFDLIYSLNKLAYKMTGDINVSADNHQETMAVCLLIRIHEGTQAAAILLSVGLLNDTMVVLRGLIEAYFHLKLVCEDRAYVEEYVKASELKNQKKIVKEISGNSPMLQEHIATLSPGEKNQHISQKEELKQYDIRIDALATKAGMKDWYDTVYYVLSDMVHASSRAMECYLELSGNNEVKGFVCGPRTTNNYKMVVHLAAEVLGHTLNSVNKLFCLNLESELSALAARSNALAD